MPMMATYWSPGVSDGEGGKSFGPPSTVYCRWQNDAIMFRSATGEELTSSAIAYVNRADLQVDGFMALGQHTGAPNTVQGACEIKNIMSSPSLRNDRVLYKVMLFGFQQVNG